MSITVSAQHALTHASERGATVGRRRGQLQPLHFNFCSWQPGPPNAIIFNNHSQLTANAWSDRPPYPIAEYTSPPKTRPKGPKENPRPHLTGTKAVRLWQTVPARTVCHKHNTFDPYSEPNRHPRSPPTRPPNP